MPAGRSACGRHTEVAELQASHGGIVKTCGSACQLFFPPAVSLTRLTFAAVLAMVKPWAGLLESNGDESRRGSQSFSPTPDQPHSRRTT